MINFTDDRPRLLIFDPNASPETKTNDNIMFAWGMALRLGYYVEFHDYATMADNSRVYQDQWDGIIVPYTQGIAGTYTNLQDALAKFSDTTIPVAVVGAFNANQGTAITGVTTTNAGTREVATTAIKNWNGRKSASVQKFYGRFPELADMTSIATIHADDGTYVALWSTTVSSHPVFWQNGHTTSDQQIEKLWFHYQWIVDQQSTEAKRTALKGKIKKAPLLFRWDGLDIVAMRTAFTAGDLDTVYDAALAYGSSTHKIEQHLAATWVGLTDPGDGDPALLQWFVDRDRSNGGLFHTHNHHTDVVDGVTDACTSNGTAFDQFTAAGRIYEADCLKLTNAGFQVGSDGLGKGSPCVQNGNDMNNPAALFLGGANVLGAKEWDATDEQFYGGYEVGALWLQRTTSYPSGGGTPETPAAPVYHAKNWNGAYTISSFNTDNIDNATAFEISITLNQTILRMMIIGGGLYFHGNGLTNFAGYCEQIFTIFSTCPDVTRAGPWADILTDIKRGPGIWLSS